MHANVNVLNLLFSCDLFLEQLRLLVRLEVGSVEFDTIFLFESVTFLSLAPLTNKTNQVAC